MGDDTMTDGALHAQLAQLTDKVSDIRTDVAVIKVQTSSIPNLDERVRSLELSRSRIWAWWSVAAIIGAAAGWALGTIVRLR